MRNQNAVQEKTDKDSTQLRQERRIRWLHGFDGPRARLIAILYFGDAE